MSRSILLRAPLWKNNILLQVARNRIPQVLTLQPLITKQSLSVPIRPVTKHRDNSMVWTQLLGDFLRSNDVQRTARSEVQAVTVRRWQIGGTLTPVHILELDNDASKDDLYLHSFNIPDPSRL